MLTYGWMKGGTDRRTEMAKIIVVLRNFAITPEYQKMAKIYFSGLTRYIQDVFISKLYRYICYPYGSIFHVPQSPDRNVNWY
jgi:hypothetical protein